MNEIILEQEGKTAINRVYHQLRTMIIKCELSPGEKLKIESLKNRLDIGASPIREALSLLTSDGLVNRLDQRGFIVAPISRANFDEILMLRCQLDVLALQQSIEFGDQQWEEKLVILHHRLNRADPSDFETWENTHKSFHMGLISQCNSPILLRYCNQLYDQNIRYRFLAEESVDYQNRKVSDEHGEILQATLDRNASVASDSLIKHYKRTGKGLVSVLEKSRLHAWI
ncbi:GntR family transcriptional regulator [Vibrio ulleungensis]|uniref:GntR family transcriptional regulator n=1 Tax=Vibrio ulleungensis TaxID=2807619 RepID=A0ABS2HN69_9VIBR|nr:GntR family transcriptional regulator [Vibrio ulleungensis]MBM7038484.1 GntR family transcriptional regulator [Vibrio ulleungensis]